MEDLEKIVSVNEEELAVFPQAGEAVIPDEVLPAEEAPKLTAQQIKAINVQGSGAVFHRATPQHNLGKKSSNNSSKKISKKAEKKAKESRKKNHRIANKKFRPSGSKKRK